MLGWKIKSLGDLYKEGIKSIMCMHAAQPRIRCQSSRVWT